MATPVQRFARLVLRGPAGDLTVRELVEGAQLVAQALEPPPAPPVPAMPAGWVPSALAAPAAPPRRAARATVDDVVELVEVDGVWITKAEAARRRRTPR